MNILDRIVATFSPARAVHRAHARATLEQIDQLAGGTAGYDAAKINRLTRALNKSTQTENAIPRGQLSRLRAASRDLYRNNPHARKIIRQLCAKVIGPTGMRPQSQAKQSDSDDPHTEFRSSAADLWESISDKFDYRGRPGRGGQTLAGLAHTTLANTVLDGEVLPRFRPLDRNAQFRLGLPVPVQLQLVHAERLDERQINDSIFYGIELDNDDRRVAYHILTSHPADPRFHRDDGNTTRVDATDMLHVFASEDVDQLRGVPWFAALLKTARHVDDYTFSELQAAAMSACVVLGYRPSSGHDAFGPAAPSEWDTSDEDGNKYENIAPGMILNLGSTGEIQGFDPQRPNRNAGEFVEHMLAGQAAGVPGIKRTTLTGNYKGSSFSSEKAGDNDNWPELLNLQQWFAASFYQPIYERIVDEAMAAGWFSGVITAREYVDRRGDLLRCNWQGPVAQSINPEKDAMAASARIRNGTSTPQRESANLGRNWQELLQETADYAAFATSIGVPTDLINQHLGITQQDTSPDEPIAENLTEEFDESQTSEPAVAK